MKIQNKLAMMILCAMSAVALTSTQAKAEILPLPTYNLMNNGIWVTIYNFAGMQTDWGCVPAQSMRAWWSGNYVPLVPYVVRAEIMQSKDCSGPKIGDTSTPMQLPSVAWLDQNGKWHTTPLPPTMRSESQITDSVTQTQMENQIESKIENEVEGQ